MAEIVNLQPTTELEAVNAMLGAIGEAPIEDLATATQEDVGMALNILRNTTREVLTVGWQFNTEFGFQLAPVATLDWPDTDGKTTTLNVFKKPAGCLDFTLSEDISMACLDINESPSRYYKENNAPVLVLYDRVKNRDGFDQATYPYLYINPVWARDYEMLPEAARHYIYRAAARKFVQNSLGSATLSQLAMEDEALALRLLRRKFGQQDRLNLFNNAETAKVFGGRRFPYYGVVSRRGTPGHS